MCRISVEPPVQMQTKGSLDKPVQTLHVKGNPLTQSNQHDNTHGTSLSFENAVSGSNMICKFDQQNEREGSKSCSEMISENEAKQDLVDERQHLYMEDGTLRGAQKSPNEEVEYVSGNTTVTEVHVNRDHTCIICNKQYQTRAGLYKHNRVYHPEEIGKTSNMFCRERNCSYRYKTLKQLRNHLKEHGIEMKMTEKHFKHYRGRFIHVTIYCKHIHVTKHNYITKHCANMYWSLSLTLSLPLPLSAK